MSKLKINDNETTVNVKNELSFTEAMIFANNILNDVISNLDGASLFIKDFIVKYYTITYYTDFEMPDDIEEQYYTIYDSGLFELIMTNINFNAVKYRKLLEGINEQIEFEKHKAVNRSSLDNLLDTINEVVKKIDGNIDIKNLSGIIEKFLTLENINENALAKAILSIQKSTKKSKRKTI